MIRILRRKFIVTAMTAVTVLLLVLLGAINGVNGWTTRRELEQQLDMLCQQTPGRSPRDFGPGFERREHRLFGSAPEGEALMSARYYAVWADADGCVNRIDTDHIEYASEEEATELFENASGRDEGRTGAFRFRTVTLSGGDTLTVLLYDAQQRSGVLRVLALSALAGLVCWGLMLLLVSFLSKKAIEPIAENMEKQKRFVTDAGHELKTPLAIILANTEALELRQGESKYTRNVRAQVERLTGLTQNLLTLARADESKQVLNAEDLSLTDLVEESVQPFREPAELRGIKLSAELQPGLTVHGSRTQLGQLLSILMDNAVKYTPEGGAIAVSLKKDGKTFLRVQNDVSDASVPPERFFDRFYRAEESRTQKSGGFGIGLSAARAIAEQHRGTLTAAYEGNSIVFTLKL